MNEAVRLPAVAEPKLPDEVAVSVSARARRAEWMRSIVDVEIENSTLCPLICDVRGRTFTGLVQMRPGYVWIDPKTHGTLHVRVGMRLPPVRSVVVRLRDNVREYSAEAQVETPIALRVFPLALICALLAALAWLLGSVLPPRVEALTAPAKVFTGDQVDVGYAATGWGQTTYEIDRDGTPVGSGTLPPGDGAIRFRTDRMPARYTVTVAFVGLFGSARASRSFTAQAPPRPPKVAAIQSLDVRPSVAMSGTPLAVRYAATAQNGTIRILDAKGVVWDAASYNRGGSTNLTAPHVDTPRRFDVRLEVHQGATMSAASIGLLVMPKPTPKPSTTPQTSAPPAPGGTFTAIPAQPVSGTYFAVRMDGPAGDAPFRAILQNESGRTLESETIAPEKPAHFVAPIVAQPTKFYVMISGTAGRSGQLIIVPVTILPR